MQPMNDNTVKYILILASKSKHFVQIFFANYTCNNGVLFRQIYQDSQCTDRGDRALESWSPWQMDQGTYGQIVTIFDCDRKNEPRFNFQK